MLEVGGVANCFVAKVVSRVGLRSAEAGAHHEMIRVMEIRRAFSAYLYRCYDPGQWVLLSRAR